MAGPKHSELPAVVVPQHLWLRSARPAQGKIVQWVVPGVVILAAFTAADTTSVRVSLVLAGIGIFILLPMLVLGRLEQLGRVVQAADRQRAAELVKSLPDRPIVRLFAPLGWTSLQLALLNLKIGDGAAAAAGFAETARLCHQPEAVMLVSAQAHAYVLAGERTKARELLQKLAYANLLGPRDQLDLGVVLLIETKKHKQALTHIEAARKTIGDHPRVLAAQALALQKSERVDEASELFEQVQIAVKGETPDPVTDDLIKRVRKGLQDYLEAQLRRERRARSRRTTIVVSSEAAASEIVSGEISGSAEPTPTEAAGMNDAQRRFQPLEVPQSAPTEPPRPAVREPDAPQPGLEIDLYSVPHTSAQALAATKKEPPPAKDEPKPRADSVAAALSEAPSSTAPPVVGLVAESPRTDLPRTDAPKVEPKSEAPRAESDVPTFRRRQTLLGVLPGEPSKPPAPSLPSLNTLAGGGSPAGPGPAMPRTGLPTRATRADLPAVGGPTTTPPTFRAPPTRNPADKDGGDKAGE